MSHPFKLKCRCGTDLEPQWTQAEGDGTWKVTPVPDRVYPLDLPQEDPSGCFDPLVWGSSPQDVDQSLAGRQTDHDLITRQGERTDWGGCTPRGQSPGPDPPPSGRAFPYLPMPEPEPDPRGRSLLEPYWEWFWRQGMSARGRLSFRMTPTDLAVARDVASRTPELAALPFSPQVQEDIEAYWNAETARLAREAADRDAFLREEQP